MGICLDTCKANCCRKKEKKMSRIGRWKCVQCGDKFEDFDDYRDHVKEDHRPTSVN